MRFNARLVRRRRFFIRNSSGAELREKGEREERQRKEAKRKEEADGKEGKEKSKQTSTQRARMNDSKRRQATCQLELNN